METGERKHIDLGKIQQEESKKRFKCSEGEHGPLEFLSWVDSLSVFSRSMYLPENVIILLFGSCCCFVCFAMEYNSTVHMYHIFTSFKTLDLSP